MSMSTSIGRYLGGKLLSAILALVVILVVIWYLRLPDDARASLWSIVRVTLIWLGFVAVLPWATFFVPAYVVKCDSNIASTIMLVGYFVVEVGVSLYLGKGFPEASWSRILLVAGWLLAWTYTYVICESIAHQAKQAE